MKYKKFSSLVFAACGIFCVCQKQAPARDFEHAPSGWKIRIPAGYQAISTERLQSIESKGQQAMQDALQQEAPVWTNYVLALQKGRANSLIAQLHPYDQTQDGPYAAMRNTVYDMITLSYQHKQMRFEETRGTEQIDGRTFHCQYMIMQPQPEVEIQQTTCGALIAEQDFSITLVCVDAAECKSLQSAWRSSGFRSGPAQADALR